MIGRFATLALALTVTMTLTVAAQHKSNPIIIIPDAHTGGVLGIFIDRSDSLIATCGVDGMVKLWKLHPTLTPKCTASGHLSEVNNVSFSGDDSFVASVSGDQTLRIWTAATCQPVNTLTGHTGEVLCVYFSQSDSGRYIATGSSDQTVKIWDRQNGVEWRTLRGHTGAVTGVAYSYNDSLIASCGEDMQVIVWSPSSGQPIIPLIGQPHTAPCTAVLFSFDSRYLASADRDGFIKIWSLPDGQLLRTIEAHDGYVSDITFAGNNTTLLSAGHDGKIMLWDILTGTASDSIDVGTPIWSIDVTSDSHTVVAGCSDGSIRVWNRRQPLDTDGQQSNGKKQNQSQPRKRR